MCGQNVWTEAMKEDLIFCTMKRFVQTKTRITPRRPRLILMCLLLVLTVENLAKILNME